MCKSAEVKKTQNKSQIGVKPAVGEQWNLAVCVFRHVDVSECLLMLQSLESHVAEQITLKLGSIITAETTCQSQPSANFFSPCKSKEWNIFFLPKTWTDMGIFYRPLIVGAVHREVMKKSELRPYTS